MNVYILYHDIGYDGRTVETIWKNYPTVEDLSVLKEFGYILKKYQVERLAKSGHVNLNKGWGSLYIEAFEVVENDSK